MSKLGSLYIELGEPEGELSGGCCEVDDWAADEITRLRAEGSLIASRLEDRTNETGNLRDKLEIANIQITLLRAEVEALKALQEMALSSRTGVTIQYLNIPPEDGEPRLVGFRVMRFHYQGPVMPTMLEAIDAARKLIPTNNTKD